jgi:pimeloyl-ACP methyl ester carboxylesterase
MKPPLQSPVVAVDHRVTHGNGSIFVRIWTDPSAPLKSLAPIVLLHDSLGCVELWHDFPAKLAAASGHPVIAYDRLGFGRSDPRLDSLMPTFISDEAESYFPVIREQLGIRRFILFGHSVGGPMAVHCAGRFPEDCEAIITESAQAMIEEQTLTAIRAAKAQFSADDKFSRLEKYHGKKAKWVLDAWTETWLAPQFASWSLVDALGQVAAPILVMHGGDDEYGSIRQPELIAQWSRSDAQVKIIPDCRHVPHREQPSQVLHLVCNFICAVNATKV